jgi:putative FmdB family regulatory protein
MPIYAYKCESCGHAKDVLQKMSDAALVDCPACSAPAFKKQLTAAGFQLKGSGWYVTDFRDGKGGAGGTSDKSNDGEKSKESGGPEKSDTSASGAAEVGVAAAKTPVAAPAAATVAAGPAAPTPAPKASP